nr:hypothetical protein [Rhizobium leguminosarum]
MQLITADPRSLKDNPDRSRQSKSSPQSGALLCASIRAIGVVQPPVVKLDPEGYVQERRRHGAWRNSRGNSPTVSFCIRRPATAVSISMKLRMPSCILSIVMTRGSMKRIVNGQGLPMLFRSCSPPMSGAWRIADFAKPDTYEGFMGVILYGRQSHRRHRQEFENRHCSDWVVIAALNSDHQPGFVECIAALCAHGQGRFCLRPVSRKRNVVIVPVGMHEVIDGADSEPLSVR